MNTQIGNELAASPQYYCDCGALQNNGLLKIADEDGDDLGQGFLQWLVAEQLEVVSKMERLRHVVEMAGDRNFLTVEAYLVHGG